MGFRRPCDARTAAFALPFLLLCACGDGASDGGAEAASGGDDFCRTARAAVDAFLAGVPDRERSRPERYGGTVVTTGQAEFIGGMNPFAPQDIQAQQHQVFLHGMPLLAYDEGLRLDPRLARSWEVAPDTSSVTFRLRHDVLWHDGTPTTARDVAFTYRRATDPATGFGNPDYWAHYVRGDAGVEVVDSFTVRIRLARPHADFLDPWRAVAIAPEHLLGDVPPEELGQHPYGQECPVGNGPFVFAGHDVDDRWIFEANPAFPEALGGRPYVDRYVYRVVPDAATQLVALLSGESDFYIQPPPSQVERIEASEDVRLLRHPSRDIVFIAWNGRVPELADRRVRRALTAALDRETIVEAVLGGYGRVLDTSVPPFHWAAQPPVPGVEHDVDAARRLLDEAGWRDRDGDGVRENAEGEPLSITLSLNTGNAVRQSIAEIAQAQLAEVGVDVDIEVVEFRTLFAAVVDPDRRDYEGVIFGWTQDFRMDDSGLFHSERIDTDFALSGTRNPELDALLERLPLVVDRAEARPLWTEYRRLLVEEQPFTFLYNPDRLFGIGSRLRDAQPDIRGDFVGVEDWWLDPERR